MLFELTFRSNALGKDTEVNILIPDGAEGAPFKTVWLLHGLHGDHTSYLRKTSIERYAAKHRVAVVMPDADRSWYTNNAFGIRYFDYITEELPELLFRTFTCLSQKREDNIVAGFSMGGYGALKIALTLPHRYGTCISLSGALDVTRKGRQSYLQEWRSIFGFDLQSELELEGSAHDIFALATKNKEAGSPFPNIYMWCGTDDSLVTINRDYSAHLSALGIAHCYEESEGDHSWKWWDLHTKNALDKMLGS